MSEAIKFGRIDMFLLPDDNVRVMKWPVDWIPGVPPMVNYVNNSLDLHQMVSILKEKGWTVRTWPTGARAWRDEIRPIRNRSQIIQKREHYTRYPVEGMQLCAVDFAYEY